MKNELKANLLINPFTRFGGWQSIGIGLVACVISALLLTFSTIRAYDYLADMGNAPDVWEPTLWPYSFGVFYTMVGIAVFNAIIMGLAGLIFKAKPRFIDLLGVSSISAAPTIPIYLLLLSLFPLISAGSVKAWAAVVLGITLLVIIIACIAWTYILFYNGYKVATGLSGNKLTVSFIIVVVVQIFAVRLLIFILELLGHVESVGIPVEIG